MVVENSKSRYQNSIYLFIGQDSPAKDLKLKKIKEEFLTQGITDFNLDVLYARELNLKGLQERMLMLPVRAKKRIIIIKDIQALKEEIKEFILNYAKSPQPKIILVLDMYHQDPRDDFVRQMARYTQVYRFGEPLHLDTFALGRQIELRRPDYALRILNQLLKNGEKPERIMGGLRYIWEKNFSHPLQIRKRLKLLLNCDLDIKRGRLRPEFALEKLVIGLCSLKKP